MKATSAELLERALDAFVSHREEESLAYLFKAWDRLRAERLAPLIERLSARFTARLTPPENSPWRRMSPVYETMNLPRYIERFKTSDDRRPPKPLDAATAAHCEDLERALSERKTAEARLRPTLEALFARVYESPDDDTPRLVLADCLMELGAPRGRHMALELGPNSGEEDATGW
ncbi:TIGR02996 domain-containing protein [Pyxidicoccus sp. 3LFB2]